MLWDLYKEVIWGDFFLILNVKHLELDIAIIALSFIISAFIHRSIFPTIAFTLLLCMYFGFSAVTREYQIMGVKLGSELFKVPFVMPKVDLPDLLWQSLTVFRNWKRDVLVLGLYGISLLGLRIKPGQILQQYYNQFDAAVESFAVAPLQWLKARWLVFWKRGEKKREQNRLLKESGYQKGMMPVQLPQPDGTIQTVFIRIPGGGGGWFAKTKMIMGIAALCSTLGGGLWLYTSAEAIMGQIQNYATATANKMARDAAEEAGKSIDKYLPPFLRR